MCGRKSNKDKDWWQFRQHLKDAPGKKLQSVTPGTDYTPFTETANFQTGAQTIEHGGGSTNPGVFQDGTHKDLTEEVFRDWYDPMFQAMVIDPAKGIMGEESVAGNPNVAGMGKFTSAEEALEGAGIEAGIVSDMLSAAQGVTDDPKILKKDREELRSSALELEEKEAGFEEEVSNIEKALETAEENKKAGLLDTKIARQEALSTSIPDYEAARAGLAKSGIAYSGPGMQAVESAEGEKIMDMVDIAKQQSDVMTEFKDTTDLLEGKKSTAESAIEGDREKFNIGLSELLGGTAEEAGKILTQATSVLPGWQQYGKEAFSEGAVGKDWYGGGWKGRSDLFEEKAGDVQALTDLTALTQSVGDSAAAMQEALLGSGLIPEEGDV